MLLDFFLVSMLEIASMTAISSIEDVTSAVVLEVSAENMKVMKPSKTQRDTLVLSSLAQGSFHEKTIASPIKK